MDNYNRLKEALINIRDYRKVMGLGVTRQAIMPDEKREFIKQQIESVSDLLNEKSIAA